MVNMVEYYALVYENGRMRPIETTPGMGRRIKESDGGVNSIMIYCQNACKCHSVPQYSNNMFIKNVKKRGWFMLVQSRG
jgi:hypothetical protein